MEIDIKIVIIMVLFLFLVASTIYFFMKLKQSKVDKRDLEAKYQELEFKINTTRLDAIESKLNPHLFKNILNSIQSHAYQTYFALDKLSNVLDYILYDSRNKFVSPKEEIAFAMN